MIYKYYGPPGTGKTFKLISRAKAYARLGTPLHKIGYFAFRFAKFLGLKEEGLMKNYGPDGSDFYRYARIIK